MRKVIPETNENNQNKSFHFYTLKKKVIECIGCRVINEQMIQFSVNLYNNFWFELEVIFRSDSMFKSQNDEKLGKCLKNKL